MISKADAIKAHTVCCDVDSELCHKFTQSLIDKKQVVTVLLLIISSDMPQVMRSPCF